jgi:hypothetical protein
MMEEVERITRQQCEVGVLGADIDAEMAPGSMEMSPARWWPEQGSREDA